MCRLSKILCDKCSRIHAFDVTLCDLSDGTGPCVLENRGLLSDEKKTKVAVLAWRKGTRTCPECAAASAPRPPPGRTPTRTPAPPCTPAPPPSRPPPPAPTSARSPREMSETMTDSWDSTPPPPRRRNAFREPPPVRDSNTHERTEIDPDESTSGDEKIRRMGDRQKTRNTDGHTDRRTHGHERRSSNTRKHPDRKGHKHTRSESSVGSKSSRDMYVSTDSSRRTHKKKRTKHWWQI